MKFDRTIFIQKFTQEARELIQKLNEGLVALEKSPHNHDNDILKNILRAAHTLKGSSNILRFHRVTKVSHKMEELLTGIQDGQIPLNASRLDVLFKSVDLLEQCVEAIIAHTEDAVDVTTICHTLDNAARGGDLSDGSSPPPRIDYPRSEPSSASPQSDVVEPREAALHVADTIRVGVDKLDNAIRLLGEVAVSHRKSVHTLGGLKELQRLARAHVKQLSHFLQEEHSSHTRHNTKTSLLQRSLLMLQGIETAFKEQRDEVASMDIVLSELREGVLNMRMLPLSVIFDTFPRAVRDMSRHFHKHIDLHITGEETILDKKIIEKLNSPLIHILRNSIDHGIESPEERLAQGKPQNGRIDICASQKSGHITINIADDGKGLQLEKLKQRAIQRGILSEEEAQTLGEVELTNLVFLPRVSTSEMITDISGRGIGMDIVKVNIELLKGSVTLATTPGKGTSCTLTLPVTLSTIRSLLISSRHTVFAIPINAIEETLQVSPHDYIQVVGQNAVRLRNQIIYIVELGDILGLQGAPPRHTEHRFLLIARIQGKRIGLMVDDILDEQDMVVKQLPAHIRKAKMIAGVTISSQNAIILILHIPEILERIKGLTKDLHDSPVPGEDEKLPRILVVDDSVNTGEIEKRILETSGYRVDVACDGVDALEKLEQTAYDLIITDVEMPGMDGFTLTERLRHTPKYRDIPIVIVTSLERESDKKRGLQVGANAYITKDHFEERSLLETVESLL